MSDSSHANTKAASLCREFCVSAIFLLLLCSCNVAFAGAWDYGAVARLTSNYNDNPTLRDDDQETDSIFRFAGSYEMDINWSEPGMRFSIEPRISRDYYPDRDKKDLENTDYFLPGRFFITRATTSYGLTFDYREENILSNESAVFDTANTGSSFRADDTRTSYGGGINFNWNLSARDVININANARKVRYDLDFTGRSDNDIYGTSASYTHSLTERQRIGFTATYNHFEAEGDNCVNNTLGFTSPSFEPCGIDQINVTNFSETDNTSITANYGLDISTTLSMNLKFGTSKSDSKTSLKDFNNVFLIPETKSDSKNETYEISFKGEYERYSFTLAGTRSVRPSSQGSAQDRTDINFKNEYKITEKVTSRVTLRAGEQQSILREDSSNNLGNRKTRTFSSDIRVSWQLSKKWSVSANYGYRWRDRDGTDVTDVDSTTASSNQYRVALTYFFKRSR